MTKPIDSEPVRTATAAGTLAGGGILGTILQTASGVDWNSGVEALLATGPGVAGVAAAVAAATAGRKRASTVQTVERTAIQAHQQGLNGVPLETALGDDG